MNDGSERLTDVHLQDPGVNVSASAGAILKTSRQSAGLHIAALAVQLKVPVHRLEALEADRWDALPDMVFTRALASSVCRTLGIDPEPVLALLPANHVPEMTSGVALNAIPVTSKKMKSLTSEQSTSSHWWVWLVLIVLALAAGLYFFGELKEKTIRSLFLDSARLQEQQQTGYIQSDEKLPSPVDLMNHSLEASLTGIQMPAERPDPGPKPITAGQSTQSETVANVDALQSAAPEEIKTLVVKARGTTWIQVRNANGKIALERQMQAGQEVALNDELPLSVVVGRADLTDVMVRGQVFDLTKVSRENVARFEVR